MAAFGLAVVFRIPHVKATQLARGAFFPVGTDFDTLRGIHGQYNFGEKGDPQDRPPH
jgi:hypothetical protein